MSFGKMNHKAQMKIQQMAFMLIGITLFLVMAGMFILLIRFSSIQDSAELLEERNALLLVSKLASSPEFSCENAFGTARSNCIDLDKVMALEDRSQDYRNFWGVDGLEIRKIYPENSVECTKDNYPLCGKITLKAFSNGTGVSNFVSLCRKELNERIYDHCDLGKVIIVYGN